METVKRVCQLMKDGDSLWNQGLALDHKKKWGQGDTLKARANGVYMQAGEIYLSATCAEKEKIKLINP